MTKLASTLIALQTACACMVVFALLAPWLGSGPFLKPRELAGGALLALALGGTAWVAWRLLQASRPAWALGLVGAAWLAVMAVVAWSVSTARWN
jgi:hypothetical protein